MISVFILLTSFWGTGSSQETEAPQDVYGILGESVTFPLEIPQGIKIDDVIWRSAKKGLAHTRPGEIVQVFDVLHFKERLKVQNESAALQIQNLRAEDGGSYSNQIITAGGRITMTYQLHILRQVMTSDMEASCTETMNRGYNSQITLYCNVKDGGGDMSYMQSRGKVASTLNFSLITNDNDLAYTCTARNPISSSSTAVSPWTLCEKGTPASGTGRSQGTVSSQDVFGILGESVCFPLEIAEELKLKDIFWNRANAVIVHTSLGKINRMVDNSLEGRLLVPAGSFSLHIQNLREEDGGSYTAQINTDPDTNPVIKRKYELHVFSRVQKPNIEIQNVKDESGNITCNITMNCTVENEGKGVNYTWSAEHSEELIKGSVLNVSLMTSRRSLTYTCTASNPASENSTRITLRNFCVEGDITVNTWVTSYCTVKLILTIIIMAILLMMITVVHVRTRQGTS